MQYTVLRDIYNIHIFGGILLRMLKGCNRVLELGCGGNSLLVKTGITKRMDVVGVDIFKPYVDRHVANRTYSSCICADITEIDFKNREFDAVVCMDVLEHIPKSKVISSGLLRKMQKWADKVIITTSNGYVDNDVSDNNIHQKHLSGWSVEELRAYGYKVRGLSGWKQLRTKEAALRYSSPFLFWAGLSLLSMSVTYFIPKLSWHLLAIYEHKGRTV